MMRTWNQNLNTHNLTPPSCHKRQSSLSCPNHPDKPVTHSLRGPSIDEQINYCQKCSIMLASQGFNVVKLNRNVTNNNPILHGQMFKSERQADVDRFINEISNQIQFIRDRGIAVQDQLKVSQQNYGRIMDQLTEYFKEIETIIQVQKYTAYNSILTQRTAAESELRNIRDALSIEMQGLMGICSDIENNMQAVQSVQNQTYQTIMQSYRTKLSISSQIQDISIGELSYPVDIVANIPKELYSLADKIQIRGEVLPHPQLTPREIQKEIEREIERSNKFGHKGNHAMSIFINQQQAEFQRNHVNFVNNSDLFDNSEFQRKNQRRQLITQLLGQKLMPNQMFFRESLNLTEIRENQSEIQGPFRRFQVLDEAIPEEIQSSQESIDGYLAIDSVRHVKQKQSEPEDTQTLLIC